MKILIISVPRCGSTSLFEGLYQGLNNFKGFCEPFNEPNEGYGNDKNLYSLNYDNLIVKILGWELAFSNKYHNYFEFVDSIFRHEYFNIDVFIENIVKINIQYSKNFDKIILLDRKNKNDILESLIFASTNLKYHSKYIFEKSLLEKKDISSQLSNHIKYQSKIIHLISNHLNIPVTYYEDLFSGNKKNINNFLLSNQIKLDLPDKFYNFLNPKNRYRQN